MNARTASNLVDFDALDRGASAERRNELMRHVAMLFSVASESCTHEQLEIYDSVLLRLSKMVTLDARAFAAERIAPLRRAPELTIRRFAGDEIAAARPVLSLSPALNDRDLALVAESHGMAHLEAIADRRELSEAVTEVLVSRGDDRTRVKVARNPGARLGDGALAKLAAQAMSDPEMSMALIGRSDIPESVAAKLPIRAPVAVAVGSVAGVAPERQSNAYWLAQHDFESGWERVLRLGGEAASERLLNQFAAEDRFAEAVAVFALLTGIDPEEASHFLVRLDTEPFLILAKANGLAFGTVHALLKSGPWKHRLDPARRAAALDHYQSMTTPAARGMLALWRDGRGASEGRCPT